MANKNYIVKYFINFEELTSKAEAEKVKSYYVQFWDEHCLRKQTFYENNELVNVAYYLEEHEEITAYLTKETESITFYRNPIYRYHYIQYNVEIYENLILVEKRLHVLTKNFCPIYDKAFDLLSNEISYFEKSCYLNESNLTYEFSYHADGSLKKLTIYDPYNIVDTDNHTVYPETVGIGNNDYNFDWEGFEYFMKSEPILPQKCYLW